MTDKQSWLDKKLEQLAQRIGQIVAEKVMALLPVILASAFETMRKSGQESVNQLAENVRQNLNNLLPQLKLPTVSAVVQGLSTTPRK